MKIFHRTRRPRRPTALPFVALAATLALLLAACGGDGDEPRREGNGTSDDPPASVRREPAGETGPDPFTTDMGDGDFAEEVAALPASARDAGGTTLVAGTSPGLYGGTGDASRCDPDALVSFLDGNPDQAAAWAGVQGITPDEIAEYVDTLEPRVLLHDTRVTNHGFSGGRATPRQSLLQAGTAVLVDAAGVPRTRCACGNPLAPPETSDAEAATGPTWPGEETPHVVLPGPVVPVPEVPLDGSAPVDDGEAEFDAADDFCSVWAEVEPTVAGGPTGPEDVEAYIVRAQEGFTRLVEAAEQTDGFPSEALADLTQYRDDLLAWTGTGTPGSTELRDRVEAFLATWCTDRPEPDDGGDTDGTDPDGDSPDADLEPVDAVPGANCGSMQFFLLVNTAEELGVEHEDVSQPFFDALEAVIDGADPGADFDVADLAPMLAYEEVGCQGAQAMYELLVDAGFGDLIAGTYLEP